MMTLFLASLSYLVKISFQIPEVTISRCLAFSTSALCPQSAPVLIFGFCMILRINSDCFLRVLMY
jgi:hypothetical protein